jgi:hypothetical protein
MPRKACLWKGAQEVLAAFDGGLDRVRHGKTASLVSQLAIELFAVVE